jgi:hypothetical protein
MAVEKHTLTKKERALLHTVLSFADKTPDAVCLVQPLELFKELPYDLDYKPDELEPTLKGLMLDDYLDYIVTDKRGELVYCITMHQKGLSFARMERAWKKSIKNRIMITIAMACITGTVVTIVKYILMPIFDKIFG